LVVAEVPPDLPRYERDAFGGDWDHDPATGCNTRERVLIEESLVPPTVDEKCRSTGGRWRSIYDGVVVTDVADLQIDHFIPLADAWRSGAAAWSDTRRRAFANDLTDPDTLVAVSGSTNQSKGDSSPDEWLPPDRSSWCGYATNWVDVKLAWALTATPAEKATLVQLLAGC
ncbi:MAG: secreted protein, partial [Acidimicrobiales bacterium]|nr:secreted protein [Acidimicrobiales bacterium]